MKFYNTIEMNSLKQIDLYVDMDGVIAEYDIGNFDYNTIRPLRSNIKRIKDLEQKDNINIKILSVCKTDEVVTEKISWIKKYMSFFNIDNVILISKEKEENRNVESSELKSNYLKKNVNYDNLNIVIDDDKSVIKLIKKNNPDIIIFDVSSWID